MSGAKSFPRLFTVDEANGLLSSLRPLVEGIFEIINILKKNSATVIREKGLDPESQELVDKLKENESVVHAMEKLQGLVHEVNRFGCLSKGIEEGLVDFPCQLGDEIIFLCWRYGEESVGHWHRVEDGFAGRRPLLDLSEMGGSFYH